jgi:hypothetical protein
MGLGRPVVFLGVTVRERGGFHQAATGEDSMCSTGLLVAA